MWIEKDLTVGEIESLINNYDIEVTSADGWVPIGEFVNKGYWTEYLLTTANGLSVSCNENHLFQTSDGWKYAKDMCEGKWWVLTDTGYSLSTVNCTNKQIPIVDLVIDHPNHRYYTNGVSSHNTNVGKSLFLCHYAASVLKQGKNVLYITMEMAEERIAERIDCNLMDVDLDTLYKMSKKDFKSRIDDIGSKTHGKLVIKEYPNCSAHAGHFRALLDELKVKKNFIPDVVCIDYINICASQRLKLGGNVNSYAYIKAIAEELRALAIDYKVPVLSATQTNRAGWSNSEIEMGDTSESAGLPMTVDFLFAMIRTDELDELGQVMIKQLKSRYNNVNYYKKFVMGVDIDRFKFFDAEQSAQADVQDDPVFDKSKFGSEMKKRGSSDFNFD